MALVVADRVKETTTTTGTGAISLGGAADNFATFSSALSDGDTTYYAIVDENNSEYEVGLGTYASSGNTLARTTVLDSSNSGSAVDLASGSKDVFITYPADKSVKLDANDKIAGNQTFSGTVTLNANPSSGLQAATKQYVDDVAAEGIQYHSPVRVEQEGNLTVTYDNGTNGVGATLTNAGSQAALVIDDITMVVNDRVLIYEQTDASQNGIYTVTNVGSASTNWVLTRATDADSYAPSDPDALAQGSGFFVEEGTQGAGEKYVCNTVGTITFGTTDITFVQVATAQIYTGGTGINVNGSVISSDATLDEVTTQGATTSNAVTVGNLTSTGIDDNATATKLTITDSGIAATLTTASQPNITSVGTLTSFASTGIDDNATANVVTLAGGSTGDNSVIQSLNANQKSGFYASSASFGFEVSDGGVGGKTVKIVNNGTNIFSHNQVQDVLDMSGAGSVTTGNLTAGDGTDIDMSATADGQVKIDGNGYDGAIALNATAMNIYHNSSSRSLILGTNETERLRINGVGTVSIGGSGSGLLQINGASSGNEGGQIDIITTNSQGTYSIDAYTDDMRFLNGTTAGDFKFYKNSNSGVGATIHGTGTIEANDYIAATPSSSTARANGLINYVYNPNGSTTPTRGGYSHHVYQCWSSTPTITLTDSSWARGDIVEFVNVRGAVTITVNASRVYLPDNSNDTQLTLSDAGKFRLIKYSTTAGYWMVG